MNTNSDSKNLEPKKQSLNVYENQKQLRESQEVDDLSVLSGDEATDNRVTDTDSHSMLDSYSQVPGLAGIFIKPMHDASSDQQYAPNSAFKNLNTKK